MTKPFLPDATNFDGIPLMDMSKYPEKKDFVPCPKCKGHGKWNLLLNEYRPAHPGGPRQHFQASCGQCWSWGFVAPNSLDATCMHDYHEIQPKERFRCSHTIECKKCGRQISYSSDD